MPVQRLAVLCWWSVSGAGCRDLGDIEVVVRGGGGGRYCFIPKFSMH